MEVGVLALQGDFAEHARALTELGTAPRLLKRPEDLQGIDAVVLPGGESTTLGMLLESSELREPLGRLLASGLPAFGTCAGMILLSATVIGGREDQQTFGILDITVRRNGFGRQRESFECELAVRGLEGALRAVFIRAPVVERVGEDVEVLSEVDNFASPEGFTPVLVRQGQVLASAFHPELTADRRLHRMFVEMI